MKKDIRVGFLKLEKKGFISDVVINDAFLNPLGNYLKVVEIPVKSQASLKEEFGRINDYHLDYLFVDSFNSLLPVFFLREKQRISLPFILSLHTIYAWVNNYAFVLPMIRESDIIIAPSLYARDNFYKISKKFKVAVVPCCLDLRFIRQKPSKSRPGNRKVISFLGRLTQDKGLDTLIKSMPKIISKVKDVELNIIGPLSGGGINDRPKDKFVLRLQKKVKSLGLSKKVHFLGARFGKDKYRILSASSILINPTVAKEETFSIVNIEAFACGLPVVASDWAASKELIENGKNGFLVKVSKGPQDKPALDIPGLANAVTRLLLDDKLHAKMSLEAFKSAAQYDYRRVMPVFVRLLKKNPNRAEEGKWQLMENKKPKDFYRIFNKKFLFFLFYFPETSGFTYGQMCARVFSPLRKNPGKARLSNKLAALSSRNAEFFNRIKKDYLKFLTSGELRTEKVADKS